MAYFVAKELHLRPIEVLENWCCEELLVAYGHYANQHSAEYVENIPQKEWGKHKASDGSLDPITWLDRWAVFFVTPEQMSEMSSDEEKAIDESDFFRAAQSLLT